MRRLIFCNIIAILFLSCSIISIKETNSLESIIFQLDEQFNNKAGEKIPGAVIVFIKDGNIFYQQAFGYKDKENEVIMTLDTIFQVASISKSICALGVMKLYEEGLAALDEPVENYLSRWQIPETKYQTRGITIRRLLSHTAGTSVHGYAGYPPAIGLPSVEQSLLGNPNSEYRKHHKTPVALKRKPGQKWKYSGGGYTILQLATEEITGQKFSDYMDTNVLKMLGMGNSSFVYNPQMITNLATPYSSSLKPVPNFLFIEEAAAGLYTTAEDLANMIVELIKCYHGEDNNFVISRETLNMMLIPEAEMGMMQKMMMGQLVKNLNMGLGLFIADLGNGKITYGHGGNNQGWTSHFEFCPETKDGLIILTNGNVANFKLIEPLKKAWYKYLRNI
jgi:CubicO group peptidase (beta-lactamase class C family)